VLSGELLCGGRVGIEKMECVGCGGLGRGGCWVVLLLAGGGGAEGGERAVMVCGGGVLGGWWCVLGRGGCVCCEGG